MYSVIKEASTVKEGMQLLTFLRVKFASTFSCSTKKVFTIKAKDVLSSPIHRHGFSSSNSFISGKQDFKKAGSKVS